MISIIIPVYNAVDKIEKNVTSLLLQDYNDFEIIIVDDGSIDGSYEVCDKLSKIDNRITVIHQKNQGSGVARNNGLAFATGEFVSFVDADDWVESNYLSSMYTIACNTNSDIVISSFFQNVGDYQNIVNNKPNGHNNYDIASEFLNSNLHAGLWNKMIRRSLILDKKILFPKASYFEDMYFSVGLFLSTNKITYCDIPSYHYCVNNQSQTFNSDIIKRERAVQQVTENMLLLIRDFKLGNNVKLVESVYNVIIGQQVDFFGKYNFEHDAINRIKKNCSLDISISNINSIMRFCYFCSTKLGFDLFSALFWKWKEIKLLLKQTLCK